MVPPKAIANADEKIKAAAKRSKVKKLDESFVFEILGLEAFNEDSISDQIGQARRAADESFKSTAITTTVRGVQGWNTFLGMGGGTALIVGLLVGALAALMVNAIVKYFQSRAESKHIFK